MAGTTRIDLLSNAGTGAGNAFSVQAGGYLFMAEATFGGGSIKLQIMSPVGSWLDFPSSTLTAAGAANVSLPAGQYRAFSTTATAVYASLITVPSINTQ